MGLPGAGISVFLSHSFEDADRVRPLRNALEALGYDPLLFFLKCLSDDEALALLPREIAARDVFVVCRSARAARSAWVETELRMAASIPGKIVRSVDLDSHLEVQIAAARGIAAAPDAVYALCS